MDEFRIEEILETVSGWVLFLGIILSVVSFFTTTLIQNPEYTYMTDLIFNWSGLIPTIAILITSIATRTFLLVISEISRSLKKIKKEISESN
tara:strand:+ start:289 stop:564 length:276 start_codon:yes stop_codon:yes gene_type:complete